MRILIIEDDLVLNRLIKQRLGSIYVFDSANTLLAAHRYLEKYFYQAIILDINLPDGSGLEFLKKLRRKNSLVPILLISASRRQSEEVRSYYNLADDFLSKPFTLDELELRLYAIFHSMRIKQQQEALLLKDMNINQRGLLSKKEFLLFKTLLKNKGRILKKENLAQQVWNSEEAVNNNTLEAHISSLRRKIKHPEIKTVRGLGYCIEN